MTQDESTFEISLRMTNMPGKIDVNERGSKNEHGLWSSTTLVEVETRDDIYLDVFLSEGAVTLDIHAHHMENEETGRAFHASLEVGLSYLELERLRDFFNLILKCKATGADLILKCKATGADGNE